MMCFFVISLSLTHSLADAYNYWNPVHEHVWYFGGVWRNYRVCQFTCGMHNILPKMTSSGSCTTVGVCFPKSNGNLPLPTDTCVRYSVLSQCAGFLISLF
jgi:hypothetical protein